MAKRVVGIDIGTHSIKLLHLENSEVIRTHELLNTEENWLALKDSDWFQADVLVAGLSGVDAQVRSLEVPFSSTRKIQAILSSLLDAQLPFEIEDLALSWFLQTDKKEEQQKVLAGFAKKSSVASYLEKLEKAGANVHILTLKAAGLYDLLQTQLGESETGMLVDLGYSSTSICIGSSNTLIAARSVLKSDLSSVLHELRQTLMVLEQPVSKIWLVGGGALQAGIEQKFSQILERPVQILKPLELSPSMALAISYALAGQSQVQKRNHFNFRQNEFAFRSEMKLASGRSWIIERWVLIVMVLLLTNYGVRRYYLGTRLEQLQKTEQTVCKEITGQSSTNCLSAIKKVIAQDKQEQIPKMSATDIYLELAKALPTTVKLKVTDLDIGNKGVRFSAQTADFESVDSVVAVLSQARCFKNVDKGRARQAQSGVEFQISMDIDCGSGK